MLISFFLFTGSCHISVGGLNVTDNSNHASVTVASDDRYLVLTGLKLPCNTHIYGLNMMANYAGKIEFLILREFKEFRSGTSGSLPRFEINVVHKHKFSVESGLNIIHHVTKSGFLQGDRIAFVASRNLVKQRHGYLKILKSHLGEKPVDKGFKEYEFQTSEQGICDFLVVVKGKTKTF